MTDPKPSVEALAELYKLCFEVAWSEQDFSDLLRKPRTYLLWHGDNPLQGLALFRCVEDEAELLTLCVDPNERKRGIARSLLEEMSDILKAKKVNRLHLEVRADNHAAVSLYQSTGFKEAGRRREYYPGPNGRIDAILLMKSF